MDHSTFLSLPVEEIVEIVRRQGQPHVGVFVPDGSRRFVLAFTEAELGTQEFYHLCATLPARSLLQSLKIFFGHGLPTLLVPVLSRSVLNRGSKYRRLTALEGLRLLFLGEEWRNFYDEFGIQVRVYGEPEQLTGTECAEALAWIADTVRRTAVHSRHTLFYAIGESPWVGRDIAELAVAYYQKHGCIPTPKEQIQYYYGQDVMPADFFIMSSKLSGLGAIPRFLVNSDTQVYFLPAASAMGLNEYTYRSILYDLLFMRSALPATDTGQSMTAEDRITLCTYYQQAVHKVIGIGSVVGGVWIPET